MAIETSTPAAAGLAAVRRIDELGREDIPYAGGRRVTSICGHAPSVHPECADLLVRAGIAAISVNIDGPNRITPLRPEPRSCCSGGSCRAP